MKIPKLEKYQEYGKCQGLDISEKCCSLGLTEGPKATERAGRKASERGGQTQDDLSKGR